MQIWKFGGSSIETPERVKKVVSLVIAGAEQKGRHRCRAVVFSAFGGVTDLLIQMMDSIRAGDQGFRGLQQQLAEHHLDMAKSLLSPASRTAVVSEMKVLFKSLLGLLEASWILGEVTPRSADMILSFGERLSAFVIAASIRETLPDTDYLDARKIVITNDRFGSATVDFGATNINIRTHFRKYKGLQIVTGFIGSTPGGEITTLGRGGSDYTASIFSAALGATEAQIWTDVDGVMTADPRKVLEAFTIPYLLYEEAIELSYFGAKVIYPPTMIPVMQQGIPIRIRNTLNPNTPGTVVGKRPAKSPGPVIGLSSIDKIALLDLHGSGMIGVAGVAKRLFGALSDEGVSVIFISQSSSEHSISFAVSPDAADAARRAVDKEFSLEALAGMVSSVSVVHNLSIIAVVGSKLNHTSGVSGTIFSALGRNGINVVAIAQGASELSISFVIDSADEIKALQAVHEAFFLSKTKTINLFIVGRGLIGSKLLEQLQQQHENLARDQRINIKLVGIANSKKMAFNSAGFALDLSEKILSNSQCKMAIGGYIKKMVEMNLLNTIFVDCTADEGITTHYRSIIESSISIVTPNKRANSGPYNVYRRLKTLAKEHNVEFFYETNVGAGLPVISTLKNLLTSGDRLIRIEAVLSGTLSYIFNTFSAEKSFSEVVVEAHRLGYTEPDPREDLSGMDVARKLLILARESGYSLEMEDIVLESLVGAKGQKAKDGKEFLSNLKEVDAAFEERRAAAEAKGKVLRYLGLFEGGVATVGLRAVGPEHSCYALSGSDNSISFTTERYHDTPLVVKGPGAGAAVTAAQVFADIVRISYYRG